MIIKKNKIKIKQQKDEVLEKITRKRKKMLILLLD